MRSIEIKASSVEKATEEGLSQLGISKENAEVEKDTKKWPIFKSIKFDQNGVVLAAEEY